MMSKTNRPIENNMAATLLRAARAAVVTDPAATMIEHAMTRAGIETHGPTAQTALTRVDAVARYAGKPEIRIALLGADSAARAPDDGWHGRCENATIEVEDTLDHRVSAECEVVIEAGDYHNIGSARLHIAHEATFSAQTLESLLIEACGDAESSNLRSAAYENTEESVERAARHTAARALAVSKRSGDVAVLAMIAEETLVPAIYERNNRYVITITNGKVNVTGLTIQN